MFDKEAASAWEKERAEMAKRIGVTPPLLSAMQYVGFAPGDYMNRCTFCEETFKNADKRATTCRDCALEAIEVLGKEAAKVRAG